MSEITPEKVAASAAWGVQGWRESLRAALSMTAEGNVLSLTTSRWEHDPEDIEGREHVRHFRAVVVEGEQTPITLPARAADDYINGDDGYHWLTCGTCETPLIEVDAGTYFSEMGDAIAAHTCAPEAAQVEQSGGAA